jgi:hypothetical protein
MEEFFIDDLLREIKKETKEIDVSTEQEIRALWAWGIERIENSKIRRAVKHYFYTKVPIQFFSAPSSQSGNFHPSWHNVKGGLVRHLTESAIGADRLLSVFNFVDDSHKVLSSARDIVLAATVITDTQKNGIPWGERTLKNHGEIAADVWREVAQECGLSLPDYPQVNQIAIAVHYHYGRFTPSEAEFNFRNFGDLALIVHLLDVCSSSHDYELMYKPVELILLPDEVKSKKVS